MYLLISDIGLYCVDSTWLWHTLQYAAAQMFNVYCLCLAGLRNPYHIKYHYESLGTTIEKRFFLRRQSFSLRPWWELYNRQVMENSASAGLVHTRVHWHDLVPHDSLFIRNNSSLSLRPAVMGTYCLHCNHPQSIQSKLSSVYRTAASSWSWFTLHHHNTAYHNLFIQLKL